VLLFCFCFVFFTINLLPRPQNLRKVGMYVIKQTNKFKNTFPVPISFAWWVYFPTNIIVDLRHVFFFNSLQWIFVHRTDWKCFKGGRWGGGHNVSHPRNPRHLPVVMPTSIQWFTKRDLTVFRLSSQRGGGGRGGLGGGGGTILQNNCIP